MDTDRCRRGRRALPPVTLLAALLLVSLMTGTAAAQVWGTETVASAGDVGIFSSLALKSDGTPCIAYIERGAGAGNLRYASWTGSAWTTVAVDPSASSLVPSLALDASGNPRIAYYDGANGDLKSATRNGGTWTITVVEHVAADGVSMVLGQTGPVISYCDSTSGAVKCAWWDPGAGWSGAWVISGIETPQSRVSETSVALDTNSQPCVAYSSGEGLRYATYSSTRSTWTVVTVDPSTHISGVSLAVTSGYAHISYLDALKDAVRYARRSSGGPIWEFATADTGIAGGSTSLALNGNDPRIAYTTSAGLRYAARAASATTWALDTVDPAASDTGYSSLALDTAGAPRVSYYDETSGDLRLASAAPGNPSVEIETLVSVDGGATWLEADAPPGPSVGIGQTVQWRYDVRNAGSVALSNFRITNGTGAVVGSLPVFGIHSTWSVTGSSTAVGGQFSDTGTAAGTVASNTGTLVRNWNVTASDRAYYTGLVPGIGIKVYTNGQDADAGPGPSITAGETVQWTYVVTNTGGLPLTNVAVTDSRGVAVTAPKTALAVGEAMTCTASGTAAVGQYENVGTASGRSAAGAMPVSASDPSHYLGVLPLAAAFSATPLSGAAPLGVRFTETSTGTPTGRAWYFGDGDFTAMNWTRQTASAGWAGRYGHAAVALPDGSIVLMGGNSGGACFADAWRSTDKGATWTRVNASPGWAPRFDHSAVALADGSIVLTGGTNAGKTAYYNDVWRSTDKGTTWTRVNASAGWSARARHVSVALPDGSIVLIGGYAASAYVRDVWRSPDGGASWVPVSDGATLSYLSGPAGVVASDGSILLVGGSGESTVYRSADGGATWTRLTSAAPWSGRDLLGAAALPDGSILIMGGSPPYSPGGPSALNDVWRSTDQGRTWSLVTAAAPWSARFWHECVVLPDGSVVLTGGSGPTNDVWRLETASSYERDPQHVYAAPGTYAVALQVYTAGGASNVIRPDYITVTGPVVVPVPPSTSLPTDPNGDGVYEDVNGNGRADFADVVLYFNQLSWIAANEPISAFDCNGNGRIDFSDVVWLFNHL
ncbi:MAG: kelch repeat-containing protein [Methanospirillum sp.]